MRKNRPVLYEVVGLSRRQREPSPTVHVAPVAPEPAVSPSAPPAPMVREPRGITRPRALRFANGRLYAELRWPGQVIVGVALVVLLLIAFDAGRRAARPRQDAPVAPAAEKAAAPAPAKPVSPSVDLAPEHRPGEKKRVATPVTPPAETHNEPPAQLPAPVAAPEPAEPAERSSAFEAKPGAHYLVIQHFRKNQEDAALSALHFLRERGVECRVGRGGDLQLFATEPFALDQKDANARNAEKRRMEELKAKIREIGKEYGKEHGYAFEQVYERVLRK